MPPDVADSTPRPVSSRSSVALRILVCEDEALVAAEIVGQLHDMGHEVVGLVANGDRIVDEARRLKPDFVVTDIRMPGRHPLSAVKQVLDDLRIPCIVLSAYSDRREIQGAQDAGAFGYLVKPVQPDQFRAAIHMAHDRFLRSESERSANIDLQRRLEERRIIEQAKWVLVQREGITESEAYDQLQRRARTSRVRMIDIAKLIAYEGARPGTA